MDENNLNQPYNKLTSDQSPSTSSGKASRTLLPHCADTEQNINRSDSNAQESEAIDLKCVSSSHESRVENRTIVRLQHELAAG